MSGKGGGGILGALGSLLNGLVTAGIGGAALAFALLGLVGAFLWPVILLWLLFESVRYATWVDPPPNKWGEVEKRFDIRSAWVGFIVFTLVTLFCCHFFGFIMDDLFYHPITGHRVLMEMGFYKPEINYN